MKNILTIIFLSTLWYPPIFKFFPQNIILTIFICTLFFKDLVKNIYLNYKSLNRLLLIYFIISFLIFIVQTFERGFKNFEAEFYITIMNSLISPLVFYITFSFNKRKDIKMLSKMITFFCFVSSFFILYSQVGLDFNLFDREGRVFLPLINNSIAPTTFSIVILFCFYIHFISQNLFSKVYVLLVSLGYIFILYLLATRFSLFGGILILIVMLNKYFNWRYLILFPLIFLITQQSLENFSFNERLVYRLSNITSFEGLIQDKSLLVRFGLWIDALDIIINNPLGKGYMYFVENHGTRTSFGFWKGLNTHNEFLLQVVANGWIIIIILSLLIRKFFKIIYNKNKLYMIGLLGAFFIPAMFDTFSNNPGSINTVPLLFLVLGLTFNKINYDRRDNQKIKTNTVHFI